MLSFVRTELLSPSIFFSHLTWGRCSVVFSLIRVPLMSLALFLFLRVAGYLLPMAKCLYSKNSPFHIHDGRTLPYLTLPHLALPYLTLPYLTLPYLALPYLTLPYRISVGIRY